MTDGYASLHIRIPASVRSKLDRAAAEATLERGRAVRLADLVRESLAAHLGIAATTDVAPVGRPPAVARHRVRPASPPAAA